MSTVQVSPFLKSLGTVTKVPIVTAALAYDSPSGLTYILLIHQALYFEELEHNLLCPMQLRCNDVEVNERPKFLSTPPTTRDHSLVIDKLIIPLEINGVTSYFPTRKPTSQELEDCTHLELTAPEPLWQPNSTKFQEEEDILLNLNAAPYEQFRTTSAYTTNPMTLELTDPSYLAQRLISAVRIQDSDTDKPSAPHQGCETCPNHEYQDSQDDLSQVQVASFQSGKTTLISPERLARTWNIGLPAAKKTLQVTTQKGVRSVLNPSIERRWPTGDRPLRYKKLGFPVYHDVFKANIVSHRNNKCAEIYASDFGWSRTFPMQKEADVHETLDIFLSRYGVPDSFISDGARAFEFGKFRKKARDAGCYCKLTDPYSPWQNRAESEIWEVKRLAGRWMLRARSPKRLWDDCVELASLVRSNTAHDIYKLNGQVPDTVMFGQTADISHICEYHWYSWVLFRDSTVSFPEEAMVLGRYLGPTDPEAGSVMSAKILKDTGKVVRRNTFRGLTQEEVDSVEMKKRCSDFDKKVHEKLGHAITEKELSGISINAITPEYEAYESFEEDRPDLSMPDTDTFQVGDEYEPESYDGYITSQVLLPRGDDMKLGTVRQRKRDENNTPIGTGHDNPVLDTRIYEVEFGDGQVLEYSANVIAENLYSQVDEEGHRHVILDAITDHKSNASAVPKDDEFVTIRGKNHRRKTTKGWKLCVQWKDGSTSWERLADLKESYPVEVAEYAVSAKIVEEPAFAWWVPYTLKRRERIIAAVNKRYHQRTHKFGIEVPKTVQEALELDKKNGNHLWFEAILLEVKNVDIAFEDLPEGAAIPPGYQYINCHWVFDVKMGSLKRKARLVAGGHRTDDPGVPTYASVVSRESVRLGLLIAALNDLEVFTADIQNAYLTSPCKEKIYTKLGLEFGPNREGKHALIVRSLYGLKASGASFRNHLASCLAHLGYTSSQGDADVWFRPATKANGEEIYEYLFIHTDDIMAVGVDPMQSLGRINKYFQLKPDSLVPPDVYLGTKLKLTTLPNGTKAWGQSS
jgi:Reverse transcriptase (RNA-dependent DNA polymerase)